VCVENRHIGVVRISRDVKATQVIGIAAAISVIRIFTVSESVVNRLIMFSEVIDITELIKL
jgi:hypothetical protein